MAMKDLKKPFSLYRASIAWFDGKRCLDEAKISVEEVLVTRHDPRRDEFFAESGQIGRFISRNIIGHLRDKKSCPVAPSALWWESRTQAVSTLRAIQLKNAKRRVAEAKDGHKDMHAEFARQTRQFDKDVEAQQKLIAEREEYLEKMIAKFKAEAGR